jgi:hypothetical protein
MYTYMYVYIYVYVYVYTPTYTTHNTHIHMYTYVTYVCMYVYIYITFMKSVWCTILWSRPLLLRTILVAGTILGFAFLAALLCGD